MAATGAGEMNTESPWPLVRFWHVLFLGLLLLPAGLAAEPRVRFEIRRVVEHPQRGSMPMKLRDSDQVLQVSLDAEVTSRDVEKVVQGAARGGASAVGVYLRPRAADRLQALTTRNQGGRLAIVIDGELVSAPFIRGAIRDRFEVTGLSGEEATRIYEALRGWRNPARQGRISRRH